MIQHERVTVEDALRSAFRDDPLAVNRILKADKAETVRLTYTVNFSCSAKYAKAILADYIKEQARDN